MFLQLLAEKLHTLRDSKFGREGAWVWSLTKKKNNKPRVNLEPRSAHGRAVKNVLSTGHRALEGVSQLKRNRSQNYTGYAPLNSFSKDNEKSQPQPQKKGRPSIIDSGDKN